MNTLFPGYKFRAGESGIFIEIYLPKKARFQGVLYQTLSEGFSTQCVQKHLVDHFDAINDFMLEYYPFEFTRDSIEQMPQIMGGYSLYEVDGVFYDSEAKAPIEERTQIIRIMFRTPDFEALLTQDAELRKQVIREFLRFTGDRARFEHQRPPTLNIAPAQEEDFQRLVEHMRTWVTYTAVFIFGFVVFQLCKKIRELKLEAGVHEEEEIWVTSFWNVGINRVIKQPEDNTASSSRDASQGD